MPNSAQTSFDLPFPDTGRTLFEIIDGAKDGNMPTHGECYYAMLALSSLLTFSRGDSQRVAEAILEGKPAMVQQMAAQWALDEPFKREKAAFAKSPVEWMGVHNLPTHPEAQEMRRIALGVLRKVTEQNG